MVSNYVTRAAPRANSGSAELRELVEKAKTDSIRNLVVADSLSAEAPVLAPFLKGLSLLAQGKVDPAAAAFRSAMRANTDFYPAMVYLGACYAAKGQDKEAAGAWNTALIRERDALPVHVLLADALMRSGRGDLALQAIDGERPGIRGGQVRRRGRAEEELTSRCDQAIGCEGGQIREPAGVQAGPAQNLAEGRGTRRIPVDAQRADEFTKRGALAGLGGKLLTHIEEMVFPYLRRLE